ncbi:hypothetical protein RQP46_004662 [Phenoliferia psychrophenolica]
MRCSILLASLALASSTLAYSETVYLIRHGEKPPDDGVGLSSDGEDRAQCLRRVFGASSIYNIGYIMAMTPKSDGHRARPLQTVTPLANDLSLDVDISCDRDDPDCVRDAVQKYSGSGAVQNTLICWEHDALTDILKSLGVDNAPDYPGESYDIIWTVKDKTLQQETTEHCAGLDD